MQRETKIANVPIRIDEDVLSIGLMPDQRSFHRDHAPALIAFIRAWLDHDPEQELLERIMKIRTSGDRVDVSSKDIIAVVREHDRKYGNEQS